VPLRKEIKDSLIRKDMQNIMGTPQKKPGKKGEKGVMPEWCSARFMQHCDLKVG